jgi:hypothetical protein
MRRTERRAHERPSSRHLRTHRQPGTLTLVPKPTTATRVAEASLEASFRTAVRLAGGKAIKFTPVEAGVPDRIVFAPGGRIYMVELKAADGKLSPIQRVMHARLSELGTEVVTLTGAAEIMAWVDETFHRS